MINRFVLEYNAIHNAILPRTWILTISQNSVQHVPVSAWMGDHFRTG